MAKLIKQENISLARIFFDKFGYKTISVDDFDMFIIDHGLATDPKTSDKGSIEHKGFVQQRTAARRMLNAAGTYNNGNSFQIVVSKETDGYEIKSWAINAQEVSNQVGNKIKTYTEGRIHNVKALRDKAEAFLKDANDDNHHDLLLSYKLQARLADEAITMQARIGGIIRQFNIAADAIENQVREVLLQYQAEAEAPAIENKA
jgi:hypothetical protein